MRDLKGKYYFLFVDNLVCVEIVFRIYICFVKDFDFYLICIVRFFCVLRDVFELKFDDGDILEFIFFEFMRSIEVEILKCKIFCELGKEIRFLFYWGVFFELLYDFDLRSYILRYVVDNIVFLVVVRFVENVVFYFDVVVILRGEFYFEEVVEEIIVIVIIKVN